MKDYYFINLNNQSQGPFTMDQLEKQTQFSRESFVWYDGLENWIKAKDIKDFDFIYKNPPPFKHSPPPFKESHQLSTHINTFNETGKDPDLNTLHRILQNEFPDVTIKHSKTIFGMHVLILAKGPCNRARVGIIEDKFFVDPLHPTPLFMILMVLSLFAMGFGLIWYFYSSFMNMKFRNHIKSALKEKVPHSKLFWGSQLPI